MDTQELVEDFKRKNPVNTQVSVWGTSSWSKADLYRELRQRPQVMVLNVAEGDSTDPLGRSSLWGEQYFIVREPERASEVKRLVQKIQTGMRKTYVVYFVGEGGDKSIKEALKKHTSVITLDKPKGEKAWKVWLEGRAKEMGLILQKVVAEAILEETEEDEFEREVVLKKLQIMGVQEPAIKDVHEVMEEKDGSGVWELQGAIMKQVWSKAKKIIEEVEEEPLLSAVIFSAAWKLWAYILLKKEKLEDKRIGEIMALTPYSLKRFKGMEKQHSAQKVRKLLTVVSEVDRRFKLGRANFWKEEILKAVSEVVIHRA